MSYEVIARRWRPKAFEMIVGQHHVTETLKNAIAADRMAHALLFSGPRGVGKTTTARLLAKAVNCTHPVDQNPDNTCDSCKEITEGRSFDVLEIDGASNRGVEEIRNLREAVRYAPARGRFKVYIIDEVHMLTEPAFNALLKTLEEPPPHMLFVFATTEINKVPATILSRCQRFDFRRIKTEDIAANLRMIAAHEGLQVSEDALMLIARKGDGSLRDAQSLFDQVVALCGRDVTAAAMVETLNLVDQEMYFRVTDLIKQRDVKGGLALVADLMSGGHDIGEFLAGLTEHFRNLLVARTTGATELIEASDVYRKRYAAEAGAFAVADLLRLQHLVNGTETAIRWAAQPRFRLEADIVQMISMPEAREIGELVRGIDELKKKAGEHQAPHAAPGGTAAAPSPSPAPMRRPPPPPARSAPPLTPGPSLAHGELEARWQEFLGEVRTTKISLWPTLENARLLGVDGSVVRLGCPDDFQASMVLKNREALAELFFKVFRVRPQLVTEITDVVAQRGTPPGQDPAAQEHPVIAALKRELGAELL